MGCCAVNIEMAGDIALRTGRSATTRKLTVRFAPVFVVVAYSIVSLFLTNAALADQGNGGGGGSSSGGSGSSDGGNSGSGNSGSGSSGSGSSGSVSSDGDGGDSSGKSGKGEDGHDDGDSLRRNRDRGGIRSLGEVLASVRKGHSGDVIGVRLKNSQGAPFYEIKLMDASGNIRRIRVDARTAVVVRTGD
jgi:hypothetical protein